MAKQTKSSGSNDWIYGLVVIAVVVLVIVWLLAVTGVLQVLITLVLTAVLGTITSTWVYLKYRDEVLALMDEIAKDHANTPGAESARLEIRDTDGKQMTKPEAYKWGYAAWVLVCGGIVTLVVQLFAGAAGISTLPNAVIGSLIITAFAFLFGSPSERYNWLVRGSRKIADKAAYDADLKAKRSMPEAAQNNLSLQEQIDIALGRANDNDTRTNTSQRKL